MYAHCMTVLQQDMGRLDHQYFLRRALWSIVGVFLSLCSSAYSWCFGIALKPLNFRGHCMRMCDPFVLFFGVHDGMPTACHLQSRNIIYGSLFYIYATEEYDSIAIQFKPKCNLALAAISMFHHQDRTVYILLTSSWGRLSPNCLNGPAIHPKVKRLPGFPKLAEAIWTLVCSRRTNCSESALQLSVTFNPTTLCVMILNHGCCC